MSCFHGFDDGDFGDDDDDDDDDDDEFLCLDCPYFTKLVRWKCERCYDTIPVDHFFYFRWNLCAFCRNKGTKWVGSRRYHFVNPSLRDCPSLNSNGTHQVSDQLCSSVLFLFGKASRFPMHRLDFWWYHLFMASFHYISWTFWPFQSTSVQPWVLFMSAWQDGVKE